MNASDEGLVVAGEVDRDTEEGRRAWSMIKSGVAGFSIGYMAESRPREGGGRELYEIDLLEISATSKPMHRATRALSWKSADIDSSLVGTAYDPMIADGSPVVGVDYLEGLSDPELRACGQMVTKGIDTRPPVRIARFEVE